MPAESFLWEVLEQLSLLPGVELQTLLEPVQCDDWCWNDIADRVLPSRPACRDDVTVAGLIARLKQYPPDALCMGTFWLEDDFLSSMAVCRRRKLQKPCVSATTATMQASVLTGTRCSSLSTT
jgi:hypothetical protein